MTGQDSPGCKWYPWEARDATTPNCLGGIFTSCEAVLPGLANPSASRNYVRATIPTQCYLCKLVTTASWDTSKQLYLGKLYTTPVPGVLLGKTVHQAPFISRKYTQSLDGQSFRHSSKLYLCNSFHGCFVPNSKKGHSVHTLVFGLLEFHAFNKLYLISWVS